MTFTEERKPLEQRQREVDELIRSKVPKQVYQAFRECSRADRLRFAIFAGILGRDVWERFWGVYRASIELETEKILAARERGKDDEGIFG